MKIIAITGNTPHCGKTTVAEHILKVYRKECIPYNFALAEYLKDCTHRVYGLAIPYDYFEGSKNVPHGKLCGLTPRQAYIAHGEFMKQLHGKDYWCTQLKNSLTLYEAAYHRPIAVVSDVGFDFELDYLCQTYGTENVALLRVINNEIKQVADSRVLVKPVKGMWFTADIFNQSPDGYLCLDKLHEAVEWLMNQHIEGLKYD